MTDVRSRLGLPWVAALTVAAAALMSATGTLEGSAKTAESSTVTFAEFPWTPPDYILPMAGPAYFSVANLPNFSDLMYRPLYWFGTDGQPTLNTQLSVAQLPVFSDDNRVVTINLQHGDWSDGTPIKARDLEFWMNILEASVSSSATSVGSTSSPGPGWGGFLPGSSNFPGNVTSYAATGTYTFVLRLNASYNPTWYTYNELSQITPMR